jgi:hypothetical protein
MFLVLRFFQKKYKNTINKKIIYHIKENIKTTKQRYYINLLLKRPNKGINLLRYSLFV